jgi:hypothetical protein
MGLGFEASAGPDRGGRPRYPQGEAANYRSLNLNYRFVLETTRGLEKAKTQQIRGSALRLLLESTRG